MNKNIKFSNIIQKITKKEMISIYIILFFIAAALGSIFVSPQAYREVTGEGDIALKNVYAPYDFTYYWGEDEEKTILKRRIAKEGVPFYVRRDLNVENIIKQKTSAQLEQIEKVRQLNIPIEDKISIIDKNFNNKLSEKSIRIFLESDNVLNLKTEMESVLNDVYTVGYMGDEQKNILKDKGETNLLVFYGDTNIELKKNIDDVLGRGEIGGILNESIEKKESLSKNERAALSEIILFDLEANFISDEKRTEEERIKTEKNTEPVYQEWEVEKNEIIIEKGKRVEARHVAQMMQLRRLFKPGITPTFFLGITVLFFIIAGIGGVYTYFFHTKNFLSDIKGVTVVLINMLFIILASDIILKSPQPSYFVPMASIGMIIALLVGFNTAFLSVILMSILISILVSGGVELMLVLLFGSVVGIVLIKGARRRAQILWAGFFAGIANFIGIICIGLINNMEIDFFIKDGIWAVSSGLLSGFIVMSVLPLYEFLFKIPTNISLLELSDLNHPLLKRLAIEAPGTYHHSIMVGNLSEVACEAIGANSLAARVGAYYHDIGKIPKAEYFTENELGAASKHTNLVPSMSALIIAKHVKEGVEIAKKYKMNQMIIDFITQHHGNSLIAYFYQKAIEKSENGVVPNEDNFRYPGPRPQTKESAIVLLSDAVEAASRTLGEPTPASIRNLVRKIINNKFIDGQLDECDLTLKDMHQIADSFVRVLTGVFHTRLDYPDTDKKTSGEGEINGDKGRDRKSKQKKN